MTKAAEGRGRGRLEAGCSRWSSLQGRRMRRVCGALGAHGVCGASFLG